MRTVLLLGLLLGTTSVTVQASPPTTLVVVTHDSFDLDRALIASFEKRHAARVRIVKAGDAGALVSRLVLTKAAPIGDVVYGIDNTLVSRARAAGILDPYKSPLSARVPANLRLSNDGLLNTVDYGHVTLNYDRAWFAARGLALPRTLEDLTRPAYRGLLVVQNPTTSSPGLAFMLATVKSLGPDKAWDWWARLRANGVKVTRGWSEAYSTDFTRAGGKFPIVVSYATSPAAEVFYSEGRAKSGESPTATLDLPGASFLQLEGVGVLRGTKQRELARRFVDFMLSPEVQADLPTRMWVRPARSDVRVPDVFRWAPTPKGVTTLGADEIARNLNTWTTTWTKTVLR